MKPKSIHSCQTLLTLGLSLKARILLGIVVPVVAVAGYFFSTYESQRQLALLTHQILDERIQMMHSAAQIKQALVSYDDTLFRYLALHDSEQLREGRRLRDIVNAETKSLKKMSLSPTLSARLGLLSDESQQYFTDAERLLAYAQNSPSQIQEIERRSEAWTRGPSQSHMELAFLSGEGRARLIRVFALCDEIITVNRMALEQAQGDMQTLLARTRTKALLLSVLSIGILLLVMAGFALSVLFPLGDLMRGVHKIEQGDLDVQIPITTTDEVGELTDAFNRATRTIREQRDQLWKESITDHLTGAYNQRHFRKLLNQEIERVRRSQNSLALLMVDIDHFKTYNDTHGHEFGNEVIRQVARMIRETLRQTDFFARYGGDEFALLLPNTDIAHAQTLAQRLLEEVSRLSFAAAPGASPPTVSLSIGGACFPSDASSADDLIRKADEALYAAKRAGRARLHFFTPTGYP